MEGFRGRAQTLRLPGGEARREWSGRKGSEKDGRGKKT